MDISFTAYHFYTNLSIYRKELILIGITYYDRLLVFEHLKKSINHIFGLSIYSIEISFNNEDLISVRILLMEGNLEIIKNGLEKQLNRIAKKNQKERLVKSNERLLYYFQDKKHLIGIGSNSSANTFFIYLTVYQFNQYYIRAESS